MIMTVQ